MLGERKISRRSFAGLSPVFAAPVFAALGFALIFAIAAAPAKASPEAAATATASVKRQSASAQFARAEEQRAALNSKPTEKRTLADYKQVVTGYRRVAMITPRAPEVPDSLLAVAELYTEMGDRFGRSYYQSAADSYQFLVHEYPTSKYCQDAMLRMAKLQREQLGDSALSKKTYEDFLKRYPRSPRKREAQEALAELALLQNGDAPAAANGAATNASTPTSVAEEARANAPGHTGGKSASRPGSTETPHVRRIRAAANGDSTRVTIDLEDSVQFVSGRIANPDRIFFDLHAARLTPEVARGNIRVDGGLLTAVRVAQNHNGVVRVVLDVNGVKDYAASLTNNPPQLLIDLYGNSAAPLRTAKGKRAPQDGPEDPNESAVGAKNETRSVQIAVAKGSAEGADSANPEHTAEKSKSAIDKSISVATVGSTPSLTPRNSLPSTKTTKAKSARVTPTNAKPDLIKAASAPQPTRDGQSTLTRTLGLKIGRIVIDAGHGGHDTGTIGPTGLMEKDLCLDVALRLGKIIEQRLPGADVVYTRSDDTFVPLEERMKIARTEKIDESKELAEDVQDSLAKRIQKSSKPVKNRGVRKAPFVVLIGADMPSILTEISFLSNPADEQMLKKPEQRQKVAEGLYQGVVSYLESMNSVTMNLPAKPGAGHPATAAVEQSRNQD